MGLPILHFKNNRLLAILPQKTETKRLVSSDYGVAALYM